MQRLPRGGGVVAYMYVMGICCACHREVLCNPTHVPSLRILGEREPLCRGCAVAWHATHRPGQEPAIHPDAYESEEVA